MFNLKIKDVTSGYRLFKKEVIDYIKDKYKSKNFEYYPEVIILSNKKYKMKEVPIHFKRRLYGKSKLNYFNSGLGYAKLLLKYLLKL